ncbi:MAG: hypothetical protein B6245_16700 [Desulfobacteraceae bacterium 4572_88]|nr:MAG: hypothetical protein B6245_16700 [Desulfobacteraceae bacterium 4572_88]
MNIRSLGKEPISHEQPAGSDMTDEDEFYELSTEIKKLQSPEGSKDFSWKKVSGLAQSILGQHSKDLRAASYLAVAMIHQDKMDGFSVGLKIYSDLLEHFWETLYPPKKRIKGRMGAIGWWVEKTEIALERITSHKDFEAVPYKKVREIEVYLRKIDDFVGEYMEDGPMIPVSRFIRMIPTLPEEEASEPPDQVSEEQNADEKAAPEPESLGSETKGETVETVAPQVQDAKPEPVIQEAVSHETPEPAYSPEDVQAVEHEKPEPDTREGANDKPTEPDPDQGKTVSPASKPDQMPPESDMEAPREMPKSAPASQPGEKKTDPPDSLKDARTKLKDGFKDIRAAAKYFIREEPENANGYRYARLAAWSGIESSPPLLPQQEGITAIQGPLHEIREIISNLREKKDWKTLLRASEEKLLMPQFAFWLDLNRFTAEALSGLGESYRKAHDAVCRETAFFVHRLPELKNRLFADGKSFADDETKAWLEEIGFGNRATIPAPQKSVFVPPPEPSLTETDDAVAHGIAQAQKMAESDLAEAVAFIQTSIQASWSQKDIFRWHLALSRILIGAGQLNLAAPHLEQILQDMETYHIETWDPDMAVKGLHAVWVGFSNSHSDNKIFKDKAIDALHRIARIAPTEALRLMETQRQITI